MGEITIYEKGPFHYPRNHMICPQWAWVGQKHVFPRMAAPTIPQSLPNITARKLHLFNFHPLSLAEKNKKISTIPESILPLPVVGHGSLASYPSAGLL